MLNHAGNPIKKGFFGWLYSVEIAEWRVPVNREGLLAFWVSTNDILFNNFTVKTTS